MYSAGQFSKNASEASKKRKESNAGQRERLQGSGAGVARQQGNTSSGGGSSARKVAQQNRAKHRAEFEMQMGMAPHPIRSAKGTSGSSISQQQQYSNRRRRNGSGRGVAYICLGLLGGFFLVTGTLLLAFGFTSDGFSWTSVTIGMILAYCGICITFIGFLFLFICIVMCCTVRRRRSDNRALERAEYYESEETDKQNNTRSEHYNKTTANRQNGKHETSNSEQKNR